MNVVNYNGDLLLDRNCISVYNGSFLYGINCFEGLRGYLSANSEELNFLDLNSHVDRLMNSAQRLGLRHNFTKKLIISELRRMERLENVSENVYVRITFFIDGETSWIERDNISYLISMRSMTSLLDGNLGMRDYSLFVSSYLRNSELNMPPSIKAGANYLNSRYAKLEALDRGYNDALIINDSGYISESSGSCIFFIRGSLLLTPSLDCDILPSITRQRIISVSKLSGIEVSECYIKAEDIHEYDGAFLCGSMIEIMPISRIDKCEFDTKNTPLYEIILELYTNSILNEKI
jgi:branched-chain amino acid aminotransferase